MTKVLILPDFDGPDKADGGIRRVVEAQRKWLPWYDIGLTQDVDEADVVAVHAGLWIETAKPVVAHCHGLYWTGYPWARWALAINKDVIETMRKADAVTAPSKWVAHALQRGMWLSPEVMYHGIDLDDWSPGTNEGYVLWNKNRVDSICDPGPVSDLAAVASSVKFVSTFVHNKLDNIETTGAVPYEKGKEYIRNAGVYLATTRETFGIGTLEAMACGVPILGWRWGGQAEFVRHKQDGYLAQPNDLEDLQRGLEYCLANRARLSESCLGRAAEFEWKYRIAPYAALYKRLAAAAETQPRVSVVITNYNLGEYLPQAVESARQSPEDTEIIIVDDASTEPIPQPVMDALSLDTRIRLITNKENLYLSEALNVGIANARGKYILPLDADNFMEKGSIGLLADELDKDRGLDIAFGKMNVLRGDKQFISEWPPELPDLGEQVRHRNQVSSTAMYRRRVWERIGGYRRRCHTAEDADFWTRALALGFVGRRVTDAVTFHYRDRSDSMSHVQKDWDWNRWYLWADAPDTRCYAAGGKEINTYEFPLVSVVIPVGPGHDRLVLDALDSLQNQTFKHWEALVVNDTGRPFKWIHPWAKVIETEGHQGASEARNAGLLNARGDLVMFLDADDWLTRGALQLMVEAHSYTTGKCFVYGDWFVGETGEYKESPDFAPDDVLKQLPYSVVGMYKTADLSRAGVLFDTSFNKGWEDWDFALQVIVKGGICGTRIKAPLFHYRMSTGTLREAAYKDRDNRKQEVLAKWERYISKQEDNMASRGGCGGCGGALPRSVAEAAGARTAVGPDAPQEPVLLEFDGDADSSAMSYIGRVSGRRYRFGSDPAHRTQSVDARDVAGLLSFGWFRRVADPPAEVSTKPLQAKGPPARK